MTANRIQSLDDATLDLEYEIAMLKIDNKYLTRLLEIEKQFAPRMTRALVAAATLTGIVIGFTAALIVVALAM